MNATATNVKTNAKRSTERSAGAWAQVNDFLSRSKLPRGEAARALGYKDGAITHWEKEKSAPVVAGLAAECLVRRMGNSSDGYSKPKAERIFVVQVVEDDSAVLITLLKKFGMRFKEI